MKNEMWSNNTRHRKICITRASIHAYADHQIENIQHEGEWIRHWSNSCDATFACLLCIMVHKWTSTVPLLVSVGDYYVGHLKT